MSVISDLVVKVEALARTVLTCVRECTRNRNEIEELKRSIVLLKGENGIKVSFGEPKCLANKKLKKVNGGGAKPK